MAQVGSSDLDGKSAASTFLGVCRELKFLD